MQGGIWEDSLVFAISQGSAGAALLPLLSGQCLAAPLGMLLQYSCRGQAAVNNSIALPWLY